MIYVFAQKKKEWYMFGLISPSSTEKNVKIIRSDIMIRVRIPVPPLYVCEFMMTLLFLLSTKKKKNDICSVPVSSIVRDNT